MDARVVFCTVGMFPPSIKSSMVKIDVPEKNFSQVAKKSEKILAHYLEFTK